MIRRPSPAWIDLARGDGASIGEPALGGDAPAVDAPRRGENDNAGAMPSFGLSAGGRSAALLPGGPIRGRRLGVTVALILSTAFHAAAFVWLAGNLSVEGVEAETEGVSVEIVFDAPAARASSAMAGNDGADVADAEPAEQTLAEAAEPTLVEANRAEAVAVEPDAFARAETDVAREAEVEVAGTVATPPAEATISETERIEPQIAEEIAAVGPVEPAPAVAASDAIEPPAPVADAESVPSSQAAAAETSRVEPVEPETAPALPAAAERVAPVMAAAIEAEPVDATAVEQIIASTMDMVEPEPVLPAIQPTAPAFVPPTPEAATMALLAAPPTLEPATIVHPLPTDADPILLPETVETIPELRPEPPPAEPPVAKTITTKTTEAARAPMPPKARATEPSRESASAAPKPGARKAPARAVARSDEKPADAGRRPATAASAGSPARGAASPGAEAKYGRTLLSHVERHKRYPAAARSAGISGATRLAITIDRTGGLSGARVSAGSGHQILDQEALAVARRAAPYPRPPEGVGGRTFSFAVTLRFAR